MNSITMTYTAILNEHKELQNAVFDGSIIENNATAEDLILSKSNELLNSHINPALKYVYLDANFNIDLIGKLLSKINQTKVMTMIDPTSVEKAFSLFSEPSAILSKISILTPNKLELQQIAKRFSIDPKIRYFLHSK